MTDKEIFDLVAEIGTVMLSSGGEIGRTKATMENMGKFLGIEKFSVYIIANGIFMTGTLNDENISVRINEVPIAGTNLSKVEALNNLSRKVSTKEITPEELKQEFEKIKCFEPYSFSAITLATGMGCCAFCYIFNGSFRDCIISLPIGLLLSCLLTFLSENFHLPKIVKNIYGSAFITLLSCFAVFLGIGDSLGSIIIGCVMPLVPGVPLVNSIRHFFDDDYLSGVIRLADALLTALSVGVGVGIVIIAWKVLVGGIIL